MAEEFTVLEKENKGCRFLELIDINSCVGDLPTTWNNNVTSFQTKLSELQVFGFQTFGDPQLGLSFMASTSSDVLGRVFNIRRINDTFRSPYTLIQKLSSKWESKEFSVYYPDFISAIDYINNVNLYSSILNSWISFNFPTSKYPKNQILNVFIPLSYTNEFEYTFSKIYFETCNPTNHTANTLSCNGCGGETRSGGCNVGGRCFNPYTLCRVSKTQDNQVYTCNGFVRDTFIFDNSISNSLLNDGFSGALSIRYFKGPYEDNFVTKIVKVKYKNINGVWEVQT